MMRSHRGNDGGVFHLSHSLMFAGAFFFFSPSALFVWGRRCFYDVTSLHPTLRCFATLFPPSKWDASVHAFLTRAEGSAGTAVYTCAACSRDEKGQRAVSTQPNELFWTNSRSSFVGLLPCSSRHEWMCVWVLNRLQMTLAHRSFLYVRSSWSHNREYTHFHKLIPHYVLSSLNCYGGNLRSTRRAFSEQNLSYLTDPKMSQKSRKCCLFCFECHLHLQKLVGDELHLGNSSLWKTCRTGVDVLTAERQKLKSLDNADLYGSNMTEHGAASTVFTFQTDHFPWCVHASQHARYKVKSVN